MSDLISRQAVLDALEESGHCYHFWIDIENIIESLPSAEPKTEDNTNATEIYNYLKERIGDIVDDMKEFDAWFERMVWHVKECNRLTAEPKKGKWIKDGHHIRCDQCEVYFCNTDREGDTLPQNFCPNCGADMRGEEE